MEALWLSVRLATCVAVILLLIGMPLAYWLSQTKWRGKFLLESLVALPLVLPPTVLGFYLLLGLGANGLLGKLWIALFGHTLAFTFIGLVLASVIYSLPFAVQPLVGAFESVDARLLDAAAVLGAGRWRTFRQIILPLSVPGLIAVSVFTFTGAWNELLLALIFITSPDKRTVPVAIQYLITGDVFRWGLIMAASVIAAVPVMALYYLAQRFVVQGLSAGTVKG